MAMVAGKPAKHTLHAGRVVELKKPLELLVPKGERERMGLI
jgi:hypothetical protein